MEEGLKAESPLSLQLMPKMEVGKTFISVHFLFYPSEPLFNHMNVPLTRKTKPQLSIQGVLISPLHKPSFLPSSLQTNQFRRTSYLCARDGVWLQEFTNVLYHRACPLLVPFLIWFQLLYPTSQPLENKLCLPPHLYIHPLSVPTVETPTESTW